MSKYTIADDDKPEEHIEKKLSLLEKQIAKCDKQALVTEISIQGDLSYYLYEQNMPQETYFEYKSQLSAIVKNYLKRGKCEK